MMTRRRGPTAVSPALFLLCYHYGFILLMMIYSCCLLDSQAEAFLVPTSTSTCLSAREITCSHQRRSNSPFLFSTKQPPSEQQKQQQQTESDSPASLPTTILETSTLTEEQQQDMDIHARKSYVSSIRVVNLAGVVVVNHDENNVASSFTSSQQEEPQKMDEEENEEQPKEIRISLEPQASHEESAVQQEDDNEDSKNNLVVVTGETGSGKSLLIAKVADLITGGKASVTLFPSHALSKIGQEITATVEMVLELHTPGHIELVEQTLQRMGIDSNTILSTSDDNDNQQRRQLVLQRTLKLIDRKRLRVKSACTINGTPVTLKVLKAIASPLVAVVDAPAAGTALGRAPARLAMMDTGVPAPVLTWARECKRHYLASKKERQRLQQELETRTIPLSMQQKRMGGYGDDQYDDGQDVDYSDAEVELMTHWIEELDDFETRLESLTETIYSSSVPEASSLGKLLSEDYSSSLSWMSNDNDDSPGMFSSALLRFLQDILEELKYCDSRIEAAISTSESLASRSSTTSARAALERTRDSLEDVTYNLEEDDDEDGGEGNKLAEASERAHDLLNLVESALVECEQFLDDEEKGPFGILQQERNAFPLRSDTIPEYLSEWNTLARKHGISPFLLPSCHKSLRQELDGNIEAKRLLPAAIAAEAESKKNLAEACQLLTDARRNLAGRVSQKVSTRLPLLGMGNSRFEARLRSHNDIERASLGMEEVDFFLVHDNNAQSASKQNSRGGGMLDKVASSGEKARILLAIECEIPGSVRTLCGTTADGLSDYSCPPATVIYDEIDAHVGGQASVSVAQMLCSQSQSCQVVSITHSPSVAALADVHVMVQKGSSTDATSTSAGVLTGDQRRKELARMASGSMAMEEAEIFAEALIRDAKLQKETL